MADKTSISDKCSVVQCPNCGAAYDVVTSIWMWRTERCACDVCGARMEVRTRFGRVNVCRSWGYRGLSMKNRTQMEAIE